MSSLVDRIKVLLRGFVSLAWMRRRLAAPPPLVEEVPQEPLPQEPVKSDNALANIYAAGLVPAPDAAPQYLSPRRAKWAKPKGEKPAPRPRATTEEAQAPKPAPSDKPKRSPRPAVLADADPEQWGQYYFRDAILDQLQNYFIYLKRMRHNDRQAYDFHRKLGIHILPQSAVQAFDNWRNDNQREELSAWWKTHRPDFGAVSYGLDQASVAEERMHMVDMSPEEWLAYEKKYGKRDDSKGLPGKGSRMATLTGSKPYELNGKTIKSGVVWVPKFLYFLKWSKPPMRIQKLSGDGDIYTLTIYWDRLTGMSRRFHKTHKGGVPQEYAVFVDRQTGAVRILKMLLQERLTIQSSRARGGSFEIPYKRWGYPNEELNWASGRLHMSAEDYLRRCFMEAALMYESASLGSMIRVEATKKNLTATFGVEIKRTPYFFKDRDVVLNAKGSTARIFHIVRPHVRKDGNAVPMHFRGLRQFNWADYKISITVPGRDHFHLTDLETKGINDQPHGGIPYEKLADDLLIAMKEGRGAWK